jgi:hypothetical protein
MTQGRLDGGVLQKGVEALPRDIQLFDYLRFVERTVHALLVLRQRVP